jgi:uncharacterized membrane protein
MLKYVAAFFILILLDIPWLTFQMSNSERMFSKIQGGRALAMRLWTAPVVYAALAYLLVQQKSLKQAAASGLATYAVYDFTNMLTFKDYDLSFAVQDTVWGGVLFSLAYKLLSLKIPRPM